MHQPHRPHCATLIPPAPALSPVVRSSLFLSLLPLALSLSPSLCSCCFGLGSLSRSLGGASPIQLHTISRRTDALPLVTPLCSRVVWVCVLKRASGRSPQRAQCLGLGPCSGGQPRTDHGGTRRTRTKHTQHTQSSTPQPASIVGIAVVAPARLRTTVPSRGAVPLHVLVALCLRSTRVTLPHLPTPTEPFFLLARRRAVGAAHHTEESSRGTLSHSTTVSSLPPFLSHSCFPPSLPPSARRCSELPRQPRSGAPIPIDSCGGGELNHAINHVGIHADVS
jgi:hypothetical protein